MSEDLFMWICGICVSLNTAFMAWIAKKVVDSMSRIARIEVELDNRENICVQRYEWIKGMDARLQSMAVDIAGIAGKLGVSKRD